jgi:hypothetical protein
MLSGLELCRLSCLRVALSLGVLSNACMSSPQLKYQVSRVSRELETRRDVQPFVNRFTLIKQASTR